MLQATFGYLRISWYLFRVIKHGVRNIRTQTASILGSTTTLSAAKPTGKSLNFPGIITGLSHDLTTAKTAATLALVCFRRVGNYCPDLHLEIDQGFMPVQFPPGKILESLK